MRKAATCIVAAIAAAPAAQADTMSFTITVGTKEKNGVCYVYLPQNPADLEGPELEISVKASNGNVNVGMSKLPSDLVSPRIDREHVPLTLTLGNGKKIVTDEGYYYGGFYYKHIGYWKDSAKGALLLSYLNGGTTLKVEFDGLHYGPIPIQQSGPQIKNYAYTWLKGCMERNASPVKF
ncbi:MAG: hypothetical protein ACKOOL_05550 [Novosphingobium sp.]